MYKDLRDRGSLEWALGLAKGESWYWKELKDADRRHNQFIAEATGDYTYTQSVSGQNVTWGGGGLKKIDIDQDVD